MLGFVIFTICLELFYLVSKIKRVNYESEVKCLKRNTFINFL